MVRWLCLMGLGLVACTPMPEPSPDGRPDVDGSEDTDDESEQDDTGLNEEPEEEEPEEEEPEEEEEPCPDGLVCVDSFPFVQSNNTRTEGTSHMDAYGCASGTDESGPEIVYQVDVPEGGFLAASLDSLGAGVDVDVHVLRSLDPDDCVDRGHWTAGATLDAGRYYVVVDSWVNASGQEKAGDYTLTLGWTGVSTLEDYGMDAAVAERALRGFGRAWSWGDTDRLDYAVIDFARPSTEERLWVVDLRTSELLFHLLVAHGSGSNPGMDPTMATTFSNTTDSHQSSLGMVATAETYTGSFGYSLRLDGLEPGFNDRVRSRYIVIHGAYWASQDFVDANGYLGWSWGCPTVDDAVASELIDQLKGGALLMTDYPQSTWLHNSEYVRP